MKASNFRDMPRGKFREHWFALHPEVQTLVDDLGLIILDELSEVDWSEFWQQYHDERYFRDTFASDRPLYYQGYISPALTVYTHSPIRNLSDFRDSQEALFDVFDLSDETYWFFTGSLFGNVS